MHVLLYLGYAVAQLAEAPCYKPDGHGFDSRWVIDFFPSGRIMVLVLIHSLTEKSTDCLEILRASSHDPKRNLQACLG